MSTVVLDIETITPHWTPPEDKPDLFAPLPLHEPVAIVTLKVTRVKSGSGAGIIYNPAFELNAYRTDVDDEKEILSDLALDLAEAKRIVTWNGRGFDMPLLMLRAMKHSVPWGFWLKKRHRFDNYKQSLVHYDMMDQLSDYGAARHLHQNDVCRMLGMPGKYDIDGSQVNKLWSKDPDAVVRYCAEDVWQLWLIYVRWLISTSSHAASLELERESIFWGQRQQLLTGWYGQTEVQG